MTLTDTTSPGQSGPGNYGNKGVLYIPLSSRTGESLLDILMSYLGHSLGWVLPLCSDAVSIFYSFSQLGYITQEYLKSYICMQTIGYY